MNDKDFKSIMDSQLSALRWTADDSRHVFEKAKGEQKVKKKLSLGLVLALALILAATAALAAYTLTRSPEANIMVRARQALSEKYGLTSETIGLFAWSVEKTDGQTVVTLTGDGYHVSLIGVYTVTFDKDGKATATWSYDDADKALYESGDLNCPIWAEKQMETALKNPDEASRISAALYDSYTKEHPESVPTPQPLPELKEGEVWWQGEILHEGTPGEGDMAREDALKIAYQALEEDFGIPSDILTDVDKEQGDNSFVVRENGGTLWGFNFYAIKDGMEMGLGVVLDAKTGEIMLTSIITGGNG